MSLGRDPAGVGSKYPSCRYALRVFCFPVPSDPPSAVYPFTQPSELPSGHKARLAAFIIIIIIRSELQKKRYILSLHVHIS